MKRRKTCRFCRELFQPRSQTYRQQTCCSKPLCRLQRRRLAWRGWERKNPFYAASRQGKRRQWGRQKGRDYMRGYRATHSGYVERNRRLQRDRNARARGLIVKPNAWNSLQHEKLRRIRSLRLIVKPNEWSQGVEAQLDGICGLLEKWLLIVKPNAIDHAAPASS